MPRHEEYWYIKRLQKYYKDHFLQYDEEVEWYGNPNMNQWRFRIPSMKWEVILTCDDNGDITMETKRYVQSI